MALRDWVEETSQGIETRMDAAEARIDGCVTYRSLIRYDAYGEMSGRQSSSIALLDARHSGVVMSSILHRENARVYVKQVHEGSSELELSPEEQEAVAAALERRPPEPVDADVSSVAYLGPPGTHTEEALLASAPGPVRARAARDAARDGDGRPARPDRPRRGADRELARGRGGRHAGRTGRPRGRRADRGRGGAPDPPQPDRPARDRAVRRAQGALHPPRHRPVRALPGGHPARRRAAGRDLDRRGGADGQPVGRAVGGAGLGAGGRAVRLPDPGRGDVEDRDDNRTRFVWLAPAPRTPSRPREGAATTSIVFWGFNDESPGRAGVGARRAVQPRAST